MFRAVYRFYFRFAINEKEKKSLVLWQDMYVFLHPSSRLLRYCIQALQSSWIQTSRGPFVWTGMRTSQRLKGKTHLHVLCIAVTPYCGFEVMCVCVCVCVCVCGPRVLRTSVTVEAIFTLFPWRQCAVACNCSEVCSAWNSFTHRAVSGTFQEGYVRCTFDGGL